MAEFPHPAVAIKTYGFVKNASTAFPLETVNASHIGGVATQDCWVTVGDSGVTAGPGLDSSVYIPKDTYVIFPRGTSTVPGTDHIAIWSKKNGLLNAVYMDDDIDEHDVLTNIYYVLVEQLARRYGLERPPMSQYPTIYKRQPTNE